MDGGVTLLSGKKLRPYNKLLKHTIMAGGFAVIDFNAMLLEWVACGVVGTITSLVSVVWDIIVLVKDVVIGVFDLLLFVVYLVSGGSAGSVGWLAVKNFFSALFSAFGHPVKTFYQFWEEFKLEVTTIEGLLSDLPSGGVYRPQGG